MTPVQSPTQRISAVVLGALALAAGCAGVADQREHDLADLQSLVRERLDVDLVAPAGDDDAIAPEALDLLRTPLNATSAVQVALLNNRTVRMELAKLGVASADLVGAGLLSNPVLSASAKFFDGGTEIEFGLVESLFDVVFFAARKRIQESELDATRAHVAGAIVQLVHDVRRALVHVKAAGRLLETELEVLRAAQASVDLMSELHRAGNVTDPRLTAEEVGLAQAKLAVSRAEVMASESREELNVLLGLWGGDLAWTVEGTLNDAVTQGLDLEDVESRAITASLDLAEMRAAATAEARRAGVVGWEAVLAPGEVGIAGKQEVGSSEWGLGPALGFSLPIFDAGGPRRAAAKSRIEMARAQHVARATEIRSAARRLRARLLALHEQAARLRDEQLPKATRLVRETLRNYNAMQIGAFDVLVVKRQEIDAAQSLVETLRDAWLARVDLEELLAGRWNGERVSASPMGVGHSAPASTPGGHGS